MTPISTATQHELGAQAFDAGDDHLYVGATKAFQEGYREQWYSHNAEMLKNDDSGEVEKEAWSEHYRYEIEPFEKAFNHPEPFGDIAKASFGGTCHEFILNTLSDPPRVISIAAIVGIGIGNFIYQVVFVRAS